MKGGYIICNFTCKKNEINFHLFFISKTKIFQFQFQFYEKCSLNYNTQQKENWDPFWTV
jgi:hypothetical protein